MMGVQDTSDGQGSLHLTLCRGLYHDVAPGLSRDLGQPQLVFCPNAGDNSLLLNIPLAVSLNLPVLACKEGSKRRDDPVD